MSHHHLEVKVRKEYEKICSEQSPKSPMRWANRGIQAMIRVFSRELDRVYLSMGQERQSIYEQIVSKRKNVGQHLIANPDEPWLEGEKAALDEVLKLFPENQNSSKFEE